MSVEIRIRACLAGLRQESGNRVTLGLIALALIVAGGCTTPYLERVNGLTEAYERGDLSREDYMRFVHDAERWERK